MLKDKYGLLRKILSDCEGYEILWRDEAVISPTDEGAVLLLDPEVFNDDRGWRQVRTDPMLATFIGKTVKEANSAKHNRIDNYDTLIFRRLVMSTTRV